MRKFKIFRAVVTVLALVQLVNVIHMIAVPGMGHIALGIGSLVICIGSWLVTNWTVRDARRRAQR